MALSYNNQQGSFCVTKSFAEVKQICRSDDTGLCSLYG